MTGFGETAGGCCGFDAGTGYALIDTVGDEKDKERQMAESNITKQALASAMKDLMAERPFRKISITDICKMCGMNRKSFYYHFKDKYDLVNWIFYVGFVGHIDLKEYENGIELLDDMCRYFYSEREFYQEAFKIEGQNSFKEYFEEMLMPIIRFFVSDAFEADENEEFFIAFFCDGFLAAMTRWLTEGAVIDAETFIDEMHLIVFKLAESLIEKYDAPEDMSGDNEKKK